MSLPLAPDRVQSGLGALPLQRVLAEVRPLVERVAERKRVTVAFDVSDDLPTAARNELPLMRLCYLLIVRAISVTPPYGTVRIAARTLTAGDAAGPGGWIQVTVWDESVGIAATDFERVFQDFEPLELSRAEGCYGMTIRCRLAHLPGARLSMNAKWREGCAFTVRLPAAA